MIATVSCILAVGCVMFLLVKFFPAKHTVAAPVCMSAVEPGTALGDVCTSCRHSMLVHPEDGSGCAICTVQALVARLEK